jgi:DNA-binding protein
MRPTNLSKGYKKMSEQAQELVDKIMSGEHNNARDLFNNVMSDRLLQELEAKRVEVASDMLPSDERTPQELAFSKAHDIQYAEVDPHSGQELDNDFDVE